MKRISIFHPANDFAIASRVGYFLMVIEEIAFITLILYFTGAMRNLG